MSALARVGDAVQGGPHCHGGHDHGAPPTPGAIIKGSSKVAVRGMPAARTDDEGYSPVCCGGVGRIVLGQSQAKVFIEGRAAASIGTPTRHCDMAPGVVQSGCETVLVP